MKAIDFIFKSLLFLWYALGTAVGVLLIVVFTWLFGNLTSAFLGLNIIISYIIFGFVFTVTLISMVTTPTKSGNYSPAAYFFLGWLIGHK